MLTTHQPDHPIPVLEAALEALRLLSRGWLGRQIRCQRDEYAPDVIRYHLRNWEDLQAATYGISAAGTNPITGSRRSRDELRAIKSDIEMATDRAFTNDRYLMWQAVARIYRRQSRESYLLARRRELWQWVRSGGGSHPIPEPWKPYAEAVCIDLIARNLGWEPHECEEAA